MNYVILKPLDFIKFHKKGYTKKGLIFSSYVDEVEQDWIYHGTTEGNVLVFYGADGYNLRYRYMTFKMFEEKCEEWDTVTHCRVCNVEGEAVVETIQTIKD